MTASSTHLRAISFAIVGFFFWVLTDVCIKLTSETGISPFEMVGYLGLFGALMMMLRAMAVGRVRDLWPKSPRAQCGRACLTIGSNFFNIIALHHLPLTLFYITVFTAPMIIALLAASSLHEYLDRKKSIAIAAGFLGVVIAINPFGNATFGDAIGYAAALASVFCFALNTVWLRVMTQRESVSSMVFFTSLLQMTLGFTLTLWHPGSIGGWALCLMAMTAALGVLGDACNFIALRGTTAANVAQFHYTQIISGALLGYIIWHELPTLHLVAGAAIICASGLYIAARAGRVGQNEVT